MSRFKTDSLRGWSALERGTSWSRGSLRRRMNVLGHDDVAEDFEVVAFAGEFQGVEEDVFRAVVVK